MKNLIIFALMLFGAMVADKNIYLCLLCVLTGVGVHFFAKEPKKPKANHSH